ncbi:MAG: chitobiase/beta-hexosaminidase C-terminal domain-containing protein [Bacillota bacterium]
MKKKTFAALLTAALCLGLLAGCGEKPEAPAGAPAEETAADVPSSANHAESSFYHVVENAFSDIVFSVEPGIYTEPITLTFTDADSADIYYTINGHDPWNEDGESFTSDKANDRGISLTGGAVELKIRLADPVSGAVSPLITGNYNVKIPFDSTSNLVDQDSYYEYCVNVLGLMRYNLQTGERECIYDKGTQSITNLCVSNWLTTRALAQGEDYGASILLPEARLRWEEHKDDPVESSQISFNLRKSLSSPSQTVIAQTLMGEMGEWTYMDMGSSSRHVGNAAWVFGNGRAFWFDDLQEPVATEETAVWCDLLTDEIALRNQETKGIWTVLARNPDGNDERILWTSEEKIILDAIIRQKVLYHSGEGTQIIHMVYDLTTGEHRENRYVDAGREILGYTSQHVFFTNGSVPIPLDYEKL